MIKACLMVFSSGNFLYAQTQTVEISGLVSDSINVPIPFVNVFLKKAETNGVVAFTTTDINGKYRLEVKERGIFLLNFSSIAYRNNIKSITISEKNSYKVNALLQEENFALDEVIINSEKAITVKEDTIIYKASAFKRGNEENVEDLLQNLPGIDVDNDGTITVGGKEIEKLLLDGDDLFGKGYKLLSKNLDASTINKVEVYDKYSENRLLKGVEDSDKVAINLKLNGQSTKIFGVLKPGYGLGSENTYDAKANLIGITKKTKNYLFVDFNNVGFDSTSDFSLFEAGQEIDIAALNAQLPAAKTFIGSFQRPLELEEERSNFNNSEMVSLNDIFTLSEKVKVKSNILLNWDEKRFFDKNTEVISFEGFPDIIREDSSSLRGEQQLGKGTITVNYNIAENKIFEYIGDLSANEINSKTDLVFNGVPSVERLIENRFNTSHRTTYTHKFDTSNVLRFKGNFAYSEKPQNYKTNQYVFEDFFNTSGNITNIFQESDHALTFYELKGEYFKRFKKKLLKVNGGADFTQNSYTSQFNLIGTDAISTEDFLNYLNYDLFTLYVNVSYSFDLGAISLSGKLETAYKNNYLKDQNTEIRDEIIVLNPEASFTWPINKKNRLIGSVSFSNDNPGTSNIVGNYLLRDFNNFSRGNTSSLEQLQSFTALTKYTLGNILSPFYAHTTLIYQNNFEYYTTASQQTAQFIITDQFRAQGRDFLKSKTEANFFIGFLSTNLKLKGEYVQRNYENRINSNSRSIVSRRFDYGFELRSAFTGNIDFQVGTTWSVNRFTINDTSINATTQSFVDVVYTPTKKMNLSFRLDRYAFNSLENSNSFYFGDVKAIYTVRKNKLSFTIEGKNLFNTRTYNNFFLDDVGFTRSTYRLLPRFILLKARIKL